MSNEQQNAVNGRPFCYGGCKWLGPKSANAQSVADNHQEETGHRTEVIYESRPFNKMNLAIETGSHTHRPYCAKQGWLGPEMSESAAQEIADAHAAATGHETEVIHMHS